MMDGAKCEGTQYLTSTKYGNRVQSQNGGKTWKTRFWCQGKIIHLGTHPTEEQAARALSTALCKAGQDSDGLPQLSDAEKAELDAMSMEQLLDGFKAAGRVFSKGTSCYRGVSLDKSTGKWYARLRVDRHQKQLGSFTSEEEAAQAYDRAALAKHGKDAMTNFPVEQYYADGSFASTPNNASELPTAPSPSPDKDSTELYTRKRPDIPVGPWPAPSGVIQRRGSGDFSQGEKATVQQPGMSAGQGVLMNVYHRHDVVPASASNGVPTPSEAPIPATDCTPGYSAADWKSWGDDGASDDLNTVDVHAGPYNAMHWAAHSDDEADDEFEDAFSGMTQPDIEDYMASGRLEPNLHIFTNPLYPPYGTDLEHAQHASWLAFLAAKDSTDPAVWNAADAAGENLLRAYAEADTSDDDEDSKAEMTGSVHGLAEAPVVLKPGSGWHQINGTWIRRVALPEDEEFQGFAPDPVQDAVAEMSPMSQLKEPPPKKIKTGMKSTDNCVDVEHSAGDIVAKVKELTGKMSETVGRYKEGELPFWVVEAESAQMQAEFDAFMSRPQRDISKPPSDGVGRVSQAEMLELERGEEAARDPNAVITQAGRYRIRTATNGDSAILL